MTKNSKISKQVEHESGQAIGPLPSLLYFHTLCTNNEMIVSKILGVWESRALDFAAIKYLDRM